MRKKSFFLFYAFRWFLCAGSNQDCKHSACEPISMKWMYPWVQKAWNYCLIIVTFQTSVSHVVYIRSHAKCRWNMSNWFRLFLTRLFFVPAILISVHFIALKLQKIENISIKCCRYQFRYHQGCVLHFVWALNIRLNMYMKMGRSTHWMNIGVLLWRLNRLGSLSQMPWGLSFKFKCL